MVATIYKKIFLTKTIDKDFPPNWSADINKVGIWAEI